MGWYDGADTLQRTIRQARLEVEELRDAVMEELGEAEAAASLEREHHDNVVAAMDRELEDAHGEILRHHSDFVKIREILDAAEVELGDADGEPCRAIRAIVG